MNSANDGVTHVNVYSKGKTELGRLLSNFAHTPFRIPLMGRFESVEGFWYWIMTGDEHCRTLWGWEAKRYGQAQSQVRFEPNGQELRIAYRAKLHAHSNIRKMLMSCPLRFTHYYVYGDKVVVPKGYVWTGELWNILRSEAIKKEKE